MELTGLFPIIKRWIVVIFVATVMATVVGLVLGSSADKTYEAKTQLLVGPLSTDSDTMRASGALAQTYAELATSDSVLMPVATDLDVNKAELRTGVRATANSATRFLTVRARSHDRKGSAAIANAVAAQLAEDATQDPSRPEGQLRVIDDATVPSSPVSPRIDLIVPLAAIAGLLGSITLILLFEFVGDTAESTEKVDAATGAPTLALKRRRGWSGTAGHRSTNPLRIIATQADLAQPHVRCVLLTGVTGQDGTGSLALELADVWGERRGSVTVVDAGTREITRLVGASSVPGLAEVIGSDGQSVTLTHRSETVHVLGTGVAPGCEAITRPQAAALVDQLAGESGLVLVHGASPLLSAATLVWAREADATILVVRRFQTRRAAIGEAAVNLRTVDANLVFSVLHEGSRTHQPATPQLSDQRPSEPATGGEVRLPAMPAGDGADPPGGERNGHRSPVAVSTTNGRQR